METRNTRDTIVKEKAAAQAEHHRGSWNWSWSQTRSWHDNPKSNCTHNSCSRPRSRCSQMNFVFSTSQLAAAAAAEERQQDEAEPEPADVADLKNSWRYSFVSKMNGRKFVAAVL